MQHVDEIYYALDILIALDHIPISIPLDKLMKIQQDHYTCTLDMIIFRRGMVTEATRTCFGVCFIAFAIRLTNM